MASPADSFSRKEPISLANLLQAGPWRQAFPDPIPGILPFGSFSWIAGASGVGKTALIAEWCRRLSDGRSICWRPTNKPEKIGIIVGDRKWQDHRQWFDVAGFPDIPSYSLRDDTPFNWDQLHSRTAVGMVFERALDALALPPGSVLIVDPLSLFIHGNLNDYKTCAIGMGKLDRILTKRKLTTIGVMHTSKQKGDHKERYSRPQDRILGSSALLGFSDTPMYLLGPEDSDDATYTIGWIPHHVPAETFQFNRAENGLFVPAAAPSEDGDLSLILNMITEAREGTKTKEIVDFAMGQLGITSRTVERYVSTLQRTGKITKVLRGIWRRVV